MKCILISSQTWALHVPNQSKHCFPQAVVIPSYQWHFWDFRHAGRHWTEGKLEQEMQISENQILDRAMPEAGNYPLTFQSQRPRNSLFGSSQCGFLKIVVSISFSTWKRKCLIINEVRNHSFISYLTYYCDVRTWLSCTSEEKWAYFLAQGKKYPDAFAFV